MDSERAERGGRDRGGVESDGDRRAREDRGYDAGRARSSSRGGDVRPPPPNRLKDRLTLPEGKPRASHQCE